MATKYYDQCPNPSLYHHDGTDVSDCDHCYECPACGANGLAGEFHDEHCGLDGADPDEIAAENVQPKVTDRVRCLAVELRRVFSGQHEPGAPVRGVEESKQICRQRGGPAEEAVMASEIARLQAAYPDWQERLYEAEAARLKCAARNASGY